MQFPRIYSDDQGETHIGVLEIAEQESRLGPPPNPVGLLSAKQAVSSLAIFSAPAGIEVQPHNAPQPYICIVLSGEGEVQASDGTTLRLRAGELVFCDDISGKGHTTRSLTECRLAFINRAES